MTLVLSSSSRVHISTHCVPLICISGQGSQNNFPFSSLWRDIFSRVDVEAPYKDILCLKKLSFPREKMSELFRQSYIEMMKLEVPPPKKKKKLAGLR